MGTGGLHQDEFLCGDRLDTLYHGSNSTPSLVSSIINSKQMNSSPLDRTARKFQTNGSHLSKQTMSNWGGGGKILPASIHSDEEPSDATGIIYAVVKEFTA